MYHKAPAENSLGFNVLKAVSESNFDKITQQSPLKKISPHLLGEATLELKTVYDPSP